MMAINKSYVINCKRLLFILPKLRKVSTDFIITQAIHYSCEKDFTTFMDIYNFCLNDKSVKLFEDLDKIVRNLLPYLSDETILRLCSLGGTQ